MRVRALRCAQTAGAESREEEGAERQERAAKRWWWQRNGSERASERIQSEEQRMRQGEGWNRLLPFSRSSAEDGAFIYVSIYLFLLWIPPGALIQCPLCARVCLRCLCARRCWESPCCACAPSPSDAPPRAPTAAIFWTISGWPGGGINSEM